MGPVGFSYFCEGNAKKYLHRFRDKNQIEDLRKASVYLQWLIEALQEEETKETQLKLI